MKKLIFATNNQHKLEEVSHLIKDNYKILSLKDINCFEEIPETSDTIKGNASQKSHYIFDKFGIDCFADDTGLEIEVLDGRPGVYSARYAGEEHNFEKNMNKVLAEMRELTNRKARFKTVISLIINGEEIFFKGIINGVILNEKRGKKGFGYDPIFQPIGYNLTFAEMPLEEKNKISHRAIAVRYLVNYLNKLSE
ncbi:MAG: non-canonical purine NTP diphosphatase [Bacteroidales bacterium]|jgi:XTP/dITP diphosphohydrolase|nr:non-canonical purine NTP diphosphatase [Bacteroidales bacterium]